MLHADAARVISAHRGDALAVITMTTIFAWPDDDTGPTIRCAPLMGGASSIGLGLALGRPERTVIVCDGDGSILMQLGSLATVAGAAPTNFVHVVFDNGVLYEGGGRLPVAGGTVDFVDLARAAGYASTFSFADVPSLDAGFAEVLAATGPTFVHLTIDIPPTPEWSADNPHGELPDWWFTMMGEDARAMARHLAAGDRVDGP